MKLSTINRPDFRARVAALRREAAAAGDSFTVRDCEVILNGDVQSGSKRYRAARGRIARILDYAATEVHDG